MTRRLRPSMRARAGMTLLESLAVLALIALLASLSTQLLRPPSGRLQLESATQAFCATLRATRSRAIATNGEAAVVVNLSDKSYVSPVGGRGVLPASVSITLDVAHAQRLGPQSGAITFFPDGASSGGDITFRAPEARATIAVNWLTGEVRCALG
jgi:general secretion pathway protein H